MFQDEADLRDDNFGTHHGKEVPCLVEGFSKICDMKEINSKIKG